MNELSTLRTPAVIGAEIRTIKESTRRLLLSSYVELGRRLVEAKELLKHGEWGDWLRNEVEFSQSTANNLMKIYEEYGANQNSLFGEINSQALGNLSYTQAVLLLKVPKDEREDFAAENDIEHLSSRKIEQLIKEKEAAEERAAKAEQERNQLLSDGEGTALKLGELASRAEEAEEENRRLSRQLKDRPVEIVTQADPEAVEKAAKEARAAADAEWQGKLKAEKAKIKTLEEERGKMAAKLSAAEAEAMAANRKAASTEEVEELKKKLAMSDKDVVAFQTVFSQWQKTFNELCDKVTDIAGRDEEKAGKLKAALQFAVGKMAERVK